MRSILQELSSEDEVVVVDDCSTDDTVEVIHGIDDPRVRLFVNDRNRREVYSFARAIALAQNDLIFLSDQDDIWIAGRVDLMRQELRRSGALLVSGNFDWMDEAENSIDVKIDGVHANSSKRHWRNISDIFAGKTNYYGCAMAFRRELIAMILPFPSYIESHDLWIAMAANILGSSSHLDAPTLRKRRHGRNVTDTVSKRKLSDKLNSRIVFLRMLAELGRRRLNSSWAPWRASGVPQK